MNRKIEEITNKGRSKQVGVLRNSTRAIIADILKTTD